ncbi:MAG: hypothetical protein P5702_18035 [Limnospira sp. PMC 1291.21]|uniref:Uncharacterized protein n=3 Tax=Limnospira TaxID=2596745 RepID=A0A9P1P080_9CYAN|nr:MULTISPECIES: hypothetical protein [Limnospira]EKD08097.1 hypothetical protein SPLC1_S270190 [Arthrospira platensis C1]MDC0838308.1 hypothetical protein [Limnoraphis robusta]MDY7055249.1 hypothetical protein [Limnospira fusiformis LS22]QJB25173.1 hypothetical protein HFV01_04415 [Limnospira fusiformis SAG 85.79]RAQ44380.1 hypothetical protein B9S53_08960 [Arthrospira sp. O9.13F]
MLINPWGIVFVVYTSNSELKNPLTPPKNPDLPLNQESRIQDPQLLRIARRVYHAYSEVHAKRMRRPSGVAIHLRSYRSLLLFSPKPVLLPGECFIPFDQIELELF